MFVYVFLDKNKLKSKGKMYTLFGAYYAFHNIQNPT